MSDAHGPALAATIAAVYALYGKPPPDGKKTMEEIADELWGMARRDEDYIERLRESNRRASVQYDQLPRWRRLFTYRSEWVRKHRDMEPLG